MWWSERAALRSCLLLLLVLSGCGFQVRGTAELPPQMSRIYIDTPDRYSVFYRELTTAIRENRRAIAADAVNADTVIRILRDESGQRVLSVSARNVPREFDVFYTIRYSIVVDGLEVLEPQQLTLTRDYTYDETEVLGKAREEKVLVESLAADLVGLVTRRMSSLR